MKFVKIYSSVLITFVFFCSIKANPIWIKYLNELKFDSTGWVLELKNAAYLPVPLDSCYLKSFMDSAYFKPGIDVNQDFLIITADSMQSSMHIISGWDSLTLHTYDHSYPVDMIVYGTLNRQISAPLSGQSICLKEWMEWMQRYSFYLDNSPTLGSANDSLNAMGVVNGYVTDTFGNPLENVEVMYDYFLADTMPYTVPVSVYTDSNGWFEFIEEARIIDLEVIKPYYHTEYDRFQIWPEDTMSLNIVLSLSMDKIETKTGDSMSEFYLQQNYQNPFNSITAFSYSIPENSLVEVSVYSVNGQLVDTPFTGYQAAGEHKLNWYAENLPSGIYIYTVKTETMSLSKKCLLIK